MENHELQDRLVSALQTGLQIEARPFRTLAGQIGISEDEVIAETRRLFEEGKARRFGAVFDSQALGYRGTLCGASIPAGQIERCAAAVSEHRGVTHCYEREHPVNLWFTLTAFGNTLEAELEKLGKLIEPYIIYSLPAIKRFKIQVTFGGSDASSPAAPLAAVTPCGLQPGDRELIRLLQGTMPVAAEPYSWAAGELGIEPAELIESLNRLKAARAVRRICVIMQHRAIGYTANGMCTWNAEPGRVTEAGRILASFGEVTHCYERVAPAVFPFNLFAMVHSRSSKAAVELFKKITERAGLSGGQILFSTREFKKSSMEYFAE